MTTYVKDASGNSTLIAGIAVGDPNTSSEDNVNIAKITTTDPLQVTIDTSDTITVVGNVASAAADSGNPVKVGGKYNAAIPTLTDGQRGDVQLSSSSILLASLTTTAGVTLSTSSNNADGLGSVTGGVLSVRAGQYSFNGSTWDRMRGDMSGLVSQPYAMTASRWTYAAASGGISNTTAAVTVAAAAGASVRNYVTSIQLSAGALGAATEVAIRDGAAGTVLWRGNITTAGLAVTNIEFPVPLKGTANTLLEVVTLTATITGGVYVNVQGFQAT